MNSNQARIQFLVALIFALLKLTTVNFSPAANALNGTEQSNYRRIQRFYQQFEIPFQQIAPVVLALLPPKSDFIIAIDRTNWKFGPLEINILLAAVVYRATAFPLLWMLIDKKGNSNTTEPIQLMERRFKCLPKKQVKAVVADREFIGCYCFKWLQKEKLTFNTKVSTQGPAKPVFWPFESLAIKQAKTIVAPVRFSGHKLHLSEVKLAPDDVITATNGAADSA